MSRRLAILAVLVGVVGCFAYAPDLLARGDYRLDVSDTDECRLVTTVKAWSGKLRVTTRRSPSAARRPPGAGMEVSLVTPSGLVLAVQPAGFHLGCVHRTKRAHPYYEAVFDVIPPPGTVIRIRHGLCVTSTGSSAGNN